MSSDPFPRTTSRVALLLVLAAVGLAMLSQPAVALPRSVQGQAAPSRPAVGIVATVDRAHPFSDPLWLPLRNPARVSCAMSNCTKGTYHGYWAIDLVGAKGDPVYAAGAGVLHVGDVDPGCKTSATDIEAGTWVWVDHGGGRITRYYHLDSITATEGQRVTPTTVIGLMGHSGDVVPCTTNYLHFEVRSGGVTGVRVNPGSLLACTGQGRIRLPDAFGATTWDDPMLPGRKVSTPVTTSSCIDTLAGDAVPAQRERAVPAAVGGGLVERAARRCQPGDDPAGAVEPEPASLRLADLRRGLRGLEEQDVHRADRRSHYRYSVAFHNTYGNSAWSTASDDRPCLRAVDPASAPLPHVPDA